MSSCKSINIPLMSTLWENLLARFFLRTRRSGQDQPPTSGQEGGICLIWTGGRRRPSLIWPFNNSTQQRSRRGLAGSGGHLMSVWNAHVITHARTQKKIPTLHWRQPCRETYEDEQKEKADKDEGMKMRYCIGSKSDVVALDQLFSFVMLKQNNHSDAQCNDLCSSGM